MAGQGFFPRRHTRLAAVLAAAMLLLPGAAARAASSLPTPDHIIVVVLENHSFSEILDGSRAPFLHDLGARGAVFTNAFAITHPSEPNYFALFSGSTQGVTDDGWHLFDQPTLAAELRDVGRSFTGYIETGSPRKHDPWRSFLDSLFVERDLSAFPRDFSKLPTVSFVIPRLTDDMHDGSIEAGDRWIRHHLGSYAAWCPAHDSLLIVTFDEDDLKGDNRIATIFYGAHVKPGRYDRRITHYTVLRTIEEMYGLPPLAHAAQESPIDGIWNAGEKTSRLGQDGSAKPHVLPMRAKAKTPAGE